MKKRQQRKISDSKAHTHNSVIYDLRDKTAALTVITATKHTLHYSLC